MKKAPSKTGGPLRRKPVENTTYWYNHRVGFTEKNGFLYALFDITAEAISDFLKTLPPGSEYTKFETKLGFKIGTIAGGKQK